MVATAMVLLLILPSLLLLLLVSLNFRPPTDKGTATDIDWKGWVIWKQKRKRELKTD